MKPPAKPLKPKHAERVPVAQSIAQVKRAVAASQQNASQQQYVSKEHNNNSNNSSNRNSNATASLNPFDDSNDDEENDDNEDEENAKVPHYYSRDSEKNKVELKATKVPVSTKSTTGKSAKSSGAVEDLRAATSQPTAVEEVRNRRPTSLHGILKNALPVDEDYNLIYHKLRYSPIWMLFSIVLHCAQFAVLLPIGYRVMSSTVFGIVTALAILIPILFIVTRFLVTIKKFPKKLVGADQTFSPDDETDDVPVIATYILMLAVVLESILLAIYTGFTAGESANLNTNGFYTQDSLILTLRFSSITLLGFHRILRPANRADPVRTILELEVVAVCWDALDGSTLFELIATIALDFKTGVAARVLMALWYTFVGLRMAIMFCILLPPSNWAYQLLVCQPLQLAPQPTVDRTMMGLRLKSVVTMFMALPDFYSAGLRIYLWSTIGLDIIQQELCLKNLLFLSTVYSAYTTRESTLLRNWNDREIGFGFQWPRRTVQIKFFRWSFVVCYITQGALLSAILIYATKESVTWVGNIATDIILCIIFLVYCAHVHDNKVTDQIHFFCVPQNGFIVFPRIMAVSLSVLMMLNLYVARLPSLFYNYASLIAKGSGNWYSFDVSLLITDCAVFTIGSFAMFWSLSYMVFKREFTASPGNYNAIHDPTIQLVALSVQIEGALDVLSCTSLLALAQFELPAWVNGVIVIFVVLEMANACQSFGLQALLSGGHDDTPVDLVKWKAFLRFFRAIIDLGAFILRIFLWFNYNAVSSVFLIKNLYNLLHSFAQVERSMGIGKYPKHSLFTEFVHPSEWYNMSREDWRRETSNTLVVQARAGRSV